MFDDFVSIAFNTAFNSDYGIGLYKYTGLANDFGDYTIAKIFWNAKASGNSDTDKWEIFLYKL